MKKKLLFCLIIIAVLLSLTACLFLPHQLVSGEISQVRLTQVREGEYTEIQLDAEEISALQSELSKLTCRRCFGRFTPYSTADVTWEVDLIDQAGPWHIVLGSQSFAYRGAGFLSEFHLGNISSLINWFASR